MFLLNSAFQVFKDLGFVSEALQPCLDDPWYFIHPGHTLVFLSIIFKISGKQTQLVYALSFFLPRVHD